jgi:hypothetical protein
VMMVIGVGNEFRRDDGTPRPAATPPTRRRLLSLAWLP